MLMRLRCYSLGVNLPLTTAVRGGTFHILKHPQATIQIGEHVSFVNSLRANPAGVIHPTVLRAEVPGAKIIIGSYVGVSGAIICCENAVTIGDFCLLGANCAIYDTDYHSVNYLDRRNNNLVSVNREPVTIGSDCWIGANAVILKGVSIGPRSVIGANSVVVHDIPGDSLAAGNPAKVIKPIA
jgi:acetyltransferase-like isoleucine patch superfamily enzyme